MPWAAQFKWDRPIRVRPACLIFALAHAEEKGRRTHVTPAEP